MSGANFHSAPPEPPKPALPQPFQFSLRSILFTMGLSAVILALLRYFNADNQQFELSLEKAPKALITYRVLATLLMGGLIYVCLRAPYLWTYFERLFAYQQELARYRRELLLWTEQTKAARQKERELKDQEKRLLDR